MLTPDGMMIVPAGTEVSTMLLKKLHNFAETTGLKEPIYIVNG